MTALETTPEASSGRFSRLARPSVPLMTAMCVALAAVIELSLRFEPEFDPFGWLIWGRQTVHLALHPVGAPSWKPLPWLFTTPLALAGGAAPSLWLILACAGGLAALVLAYRLGSRKGGPVGGLAALLGLVLCREFVALLFVGEIEPAATGLLLGALECHFAERRRGAAALLFVVSLARPECGPLFALYGVWLFRIDSDARVYLAVGAVALVALWFLPPYIALGHGLSANDPVFTTRVGPHDPVTILKRASTIVIWPVAVAAGLGFAVLCSRGGADRSWALLLAAAAAAWIGTTLIMGLLGFPGIRRFMLPVAALGCVLGGVGAGMIWEFVRSLMAQRRLVTTASALGLLLAVLALWAYFGGFRVRDAIDDARAERAHGLLVRDLQAAVNAAGGAARLRACGVPVARFGLQTSIAWALGVNGVGLHPERALRRYRHVLVFVSDGQVRLPPQRRLLATAGPWRIYGVRTACR